MSKKSIGVLGAGAWGTTIAKLLSDKNPTVLLWAREPLVKINIEKFRINKGFLDRIEISQIAKFILANSIDF